MEATNISRKIVVITIAAKTAIGAVPVDQRQRPQALHVGHASSSMLVSRNPGFILLRHHLVVACQAACLLCLVSYTLSTTLYCISGSLHLCLRIVHSRLAFYALCCTLSTTLYCTTILRKNHSLHPTF